MTHEDKDSWAFDPITSSEGDMDETTVSPAAGGSAHEKHGRHGSGRHQSSHMHGHAGSHGAHARGHARSDAADAATVRTRVRSDASAAADAYAYAAVDPYTAAVRQDRPQAYAGVDRPGQPAVGEARKRRRRSRGRIIIAFVVVLLAIYLVGAGFFTFFFPPFTTINGQDVSLQSKSALAQERTSSAKDYTLTVTGDGLDVTLDNADLSVSFDGTAFVQAADAQLNAFAWPLEVLTRNDLTVDQGISYDEDALAATLGAAVEQVNETATAPQDATISYDDSSKSYTITAEQAGTQLDKDAVTQAVIQAILVSQPTLELGDDQLVQPTVMQDDTRLVTARDTANSYLAATQTLTANGTTVTEIGADQIAQWVTIGDDLSVSLDTDAMTKWTQGDLSKQLDTVGTTRTYTTPYGKEATVSGGTYGWSIDGATLAQTLATNIQSGQAQTVDIPWEQQGATYVQGGQDWGKRYIDADLSEQHARMYDDSGNLIWESDFVSGNVSEGRDTPTGVYQINSYMATGNVELRGADENGDGQPDYISYVTYWMPFIDNSVAFHDASWRSSFGGTIYQTNGSHGCINLPSDKAQELYSLVQVGDVVVVHE